MGPMVMEIWQKYKLPIVLGGFSLFSIAVSVILLVKSIQIVSPIQFSSNQDVLSVSKSSSASANSEKMIHVDVEGGVRAPGLYVLPSASRIDDAIAKAGGLSEEADEEELAKKINRASILVDGAKIYIPMKGDAGNETNSSYNSIVQHEDKSHNTQTSDVSQNVSININSALQSELESLSGVGPVTAKKIIDNRPYQTLEELVSKKAVGNALFEKIKGNVSL